MPTRQMFRQYFPLVVRCSRRVVEIGVPRSLLDERMSWEFSSEGAVQLGTPINKDEIFVSQSLDSMWIIVDRREKRSSARSPATCLFFAFAGMRNFSLTLVF